MLSILYEIERLGVCGVAVISIADVGIRIYKQDPIEVAAEGLMMEHIPSTTQPL
jgi:hypothetical protein